MKLRAAALLCALIPLAGCQEIGQVAGIASGAATGAATGNPAIGLAVGVAVGTATNYASNTWTLVRTGAEQDAIAQAAASVPVGGEAPWHINHTIPIGNEHGTLRVVDQIVTPIAVCRDVVFSVADGKAPPWYMIMICRDPKGWKWASAEPAVSRWTTFQ